MQVVLRLGENEYLALICRVSIEHPNELVEHAHNDPCPGMVFKARSWRPFAPVVLAEVSLDWLGEQPFVGTSPVD